MHASRTHCAKDSATLTVRSVRGEHVCLRRLLRFYHLTDLVASYVLGYYRYTSEKPILVQYSHRLIYS